MLLTWSMITVTGPDGTDPDGGVISVPASEGYLWASGIALTACVVASVVAMAIPGGRRGLTETPRVTPDLAEPDVADVAGHRDARPGRST